MNDHVFRAYDIRGLVEEDFSLEWVENLGKACGQYFLADGINQVVTAYDCRNSSPAFHEALVKGLTSTGVDVVGLGMLSTGIFYFGVKHLNKLGGVMITASHNPAEYNGFKIWKGDSTIYGEMIQEVKKIMQEAKFPSGKGFFSSHNIIPAYDQAILDRIKIDRPLKIVLDGGNGSGGEYGANILEKLGVNVIRLFCEPDGTFPNHHPDPVIEKNMQALILKVKSEKADLGIGFDGDADRIGVVDKNGRLLNGDELLSIYAHELLLRLPKAMIIGDVKCSQRLFDDIEKHNGTPLMWSTGHSFIKAKMRETDAPLAGEMSGHMFFKDGWFGCDDAIYAAARLLSILAKESKDLTELPGWPVAYASREISFPCPENIKFEVVKKAQTHFKKHYQVNEQDGARVQYPDGWGLVRASNTSPSLVLRFEASTPERRDAMQSEFENYLTGIIQSYK